MTNLPSAPRAANAAGQTEASKRRQPDDNASSPWPRIPRSQSEWLRPPLPRKARPPTGGRMIG